MDPTSLGLSQLPGLPGSMSFVRLGKFSFIMFSNKFSISCSSFSPSGTIISGMLEHLKLSWRFLNLSWFFQILLSSFCFGWMFISSFHSIVDLSSSFLPSLLGPYIYFFISLCIAFTFSFILHLHSIISMSMLITSVLNSASDRLAISVLLSSSFGVLICSFIWAIFLCLGTPVML